MGTEFAFAFDIAVIVIVAVFAFVGLKRGFAKVVLGLISTIAAFTVAMLLSAPIADGVYKNFIEKPIEEQLDSTANETFGELKMGDISEIDFDKVKVNGVEANEIKIDYAGRRKAVLDFTKIDLSETGLKREDLVKIGITDDVNLSALNSKPAELTMDDIEKYGVGRIAVAQYIAVKIVALPKMKDFNSLAEKVGKYLPSISGSAGSDTIGVSAARSVTLKMFEMRVSFKDAVMNGILKPNCTLMIRTIAFVVIFILVNIILRVITTASKLINKIPVIGKVNSVLGLVLGLVEGVFAVFVVCLVIRFVVSISSANSILFNQSAIDSTFLFKTFYNFDFLNFIKGQ